MVKHAIFKVDQNFWEAVSSGRVKAFVLDYSLRELEPGSFCVLKGESEGTRIVVYGKIRVKEAKELSVEDCKAYIEKGLVYVLKEPKTRCFLVEFDEFESYEGLGLEFLESEDLRSKIKGKGYIDDNDLKALEENIAKLRKLSELGQKIRELPGFEDVVSLQDLVSSPHECARLMLLQIGRALGFETYVPRGEDKLQCKDIPLGKYASTELPPELRGFSEYIKTVDIIWYKPHYCFMFEVELQNIDEKLSRFYDASLLNARFYIVSYPEYREDFEKGRERFPVIKDRTFFISISDLLKYYYAFLLLQGVKSDLCKIEMLKFSCPDICEK